MNSLINRISLICLLMISLSTVPLFAQRTIFSMSEYNKENGLPAESVKDIMTDRYGIPHFATDNGLFALIHNEFHSISIPEGKSSVFKGFSILKDNTVLVIADDAIYKLIQGKEHNGLDLFIDCNNSDKTPQQAISIYEDSNNRIWISDNTDLFCYTEDTLRKYNMDEKNKSSSNLRSYQFMELDQGQIIVVSQKGWFYKFDEGADSFVAINEKSEYIVSSLFLHKSNEFLLGTSKGLMNYKFSPEGHVLEKKILDPNIIASSIITIKNGHFLIGTWFQGLIEVYFQPNFGIYPVGGFPSFTINNLHKDRFGCVWSATNSGVVHLEKKYFSTQLIDDYVDYIKDLGKDENDAFFLNDKDIYKINPDYSVETHLELNSTHSTKFAVWNNLTLVGNSHGEVDCYNEKKLMFHFKLSDLDVTDIEIHAKHEAWVIANGELFRLDLVTGQKKSYLQQFGNERVASQIKYLNSTDLVISGSNQSSYLYVYHVIGDCIRNLSIKADFMQGRDFLTNDIEIDGDSIFIGSSIGLFKYHNNEIELVDFGQHTDKEVTSLCKDRRGNLWVGGSEGILRKIDNDLTLFTVDDGLPSKLSNVGSMVVDSNGILWVGTSKGLCHANSGQKPRRSPKPLLYGPLENEHILLPEKKFEVNKNTTILFDVSSLFYPQAKNQFEYCIKRESGKPLVWMPLTTKNQILISDLNVGNYQLQLRTKHAGNYYWSEDAILPIRVHEVWFLRWYSIIIFASFLIVLIYMTYITSKNRSRLRMLSLRRLINEKTKSLKQLNQQLEAANMAKDKFISILAHDLRNPFNAILGFSQMLVDQSEVLDSEEKEELIEMIHKSSGDTYMLLENLLEWANVQKGNMVANPESCNLRVIMQNNLEVHQKLAAVKKIKIEGEFQDLFVKVDKYMLDTVVRNIISNAIKYSYPEDIINIEIDEVDTMARIKIRDHGVGMSQERVGQLFHIDSVSSTVGTSEETGTGFGLMLSKEFVELNNGEINVVSEKGKGTVFSVLIPLDK